MNIRDSYKHGADGLGVVKNIFFATAADVANDSNLHVNDLVFLRADTFETKVPLSIPTLNLNTTGSAGSLKVVKRSENANHYLTFVVHNNTTAAAESFYTDGDIYYNPNTNVLSAASVTVRNTEGFNYSGIGNGTADLSRVVWFADTAGAGIPVKSDNFKYNPNTNTLTVGALFGPKIIIGDTTLYINSGNTTNKLDPDTVINADSTHGTIPSSAAVWNAILNGMKANDAMIFKGFLEGGSSAANTAYTPAAETGYTYKVKTAGYINGTYYQVNDTFICTTDGTVAATSSNVNTVKANWGVVEGNGDYLNYNGGTMYGTLSWDGTTALPTVTTASNILVVDSNITKQIAMSNLVIIPENVPIIGTSDTTLATIGGITINAKIGSYAAANHTHSGFVYRSRLNPNVAAIFGDYGNANNPSEYYANGDNGYIQIPTFLNSTMNYLYSAIMRFTTGGDTYVRFISNNIIGNWKRFAYISDLPTKASWNYDDVYSKLGHRHPYTDLTGSGTTENLAILSNGTADGWKLATVSLAGHNHNELYVTFVGVSDDSTNHKDQLRYVLNGTSNYFSVPNSDKVDGYHAFDFIGSLNWDNTNLKLLYKYQGDENWTDLITFGSAAFSSNSSFIRVITTPITTNVDINSFTLANTLYNINSNLDLSTSTVSNFPTNRPSGGYWVLNLNLNVAYKHQLYGCNIDQHIYVRSINNGNTLTWYNWQKIAYFTDLPTKSSWNYDDRYIKLATELAKVTKTLKVDTWTDMATINTLDAGTYAIQINSGNVYASGIFSACHGTDSIIDEIPLHVTDKGTNTWRPYARVNGNNLQMATNETTGTSRQYTIKILKLI